MASNRTIFTSQGDSMLPVLNGRETLKNALRQAVHNLETVGVKVLGTVINNAGVSKGCYYYGSTHE